MKNKLLSFMLLALLFSLAIFPLSPVQAKTLEYTDLYMELSISEDVIVLTNDTPDTDETWITAGITNAKSEKETMEKMNVQAIFYDPETKALVRLMKKQSDQSSEIFNLSKLSEEEKSDFFNKLIELDDETATATIEEVSHSEAVFFRYNIKVTSDGSTMNELIYSTIVNGYTISFDIFSNSDATPIDEIFIKELVDGTHFTQFLDKAEVEQEIKTSVIKLIVEVLLLVAVIALWIYLRKKRNQKQKLKKDDKAGALANFYATMKDKENGPKDEVRFINRTQYSKDVIKDFCYYNRFIKNIRLWIVIVVLSLLMIYLLYTSSGLLGAIIGSLLLLVFAYYQGIGIEKLVASMIKMLDKDKGMEAIFTFYDDYFTLSGIQYISTYPFLQITEVKQYKDFIYIYTGQDKAFYLKKDGFEEGYEAFLSFIENGIKHAKNA